MSGPAPEIIAHRGYSTRAPENTLRALSMAMEAGADAVEFDIHVAGCGTPVLFHDTNLGRTTNGVGPVRRRTLGQLKALDAGKWFGADFAGERIPSLAEAFELLRGRVGRVYPEVKGYRELEDLDRMVDIARQAGMLEDSIFISLDWGTVERILGRDPAVRIGYVVDEAERLADALARARANRRSFLDMDVRLALEDPGFVEKARADGVEVGVWTVNSPADADALAGAGVSRFTTDEVDELLAWKGGRGE